RALTVAESRRVLCRALYGADQPPGTTRQAGRTPAVAPAPPSASADVPARSAAEERLRRGRVSVRGEQLVKFEKLMRSSLSALSGAHEVLNRLSVPRDAIPELQRARPISCASWPSTPAEVQKPSSATASLPLTKLVPPINVADGRHAVQFFVPIHARHMLGRAITLPHSTLCS